MGQKGWALGNTSVQTTATSGYFTVNEAAITWHQRLKQETGICFIRMPQELRLANSRHSTDFVAGNFVAQNLPQYLLQHLVPTGPYARECRLHLDIGNDADALYRTLVGISASSEPPGGSFESAACARPTRLTKPKVSKTRSIRFQTITYPYAVQTSFPMSSSGGFAFSLHIPAILDDIPLRASANTRAKAVGV